MFALLTKDVCKCGCLIVITAWRSSCLGNHSLFGSSSAELHVAEFMKYTWVFVLPMACVGIAI